MSTSSKSVTAGLILGIIAVTAIAQANLFNHFNSKRTENMPIDEKTIRDIIRTQYPGFVRASDAKGYASQFTSDALWMPPGESNQKGPGAIAESLGEEFKSVRLHPVVTIQEVSILGDHAYVIGKDELAIIPKDGSDEMHVVYTIFWLFRKVDNRWKIARQIWNQKPAAG